MNVAFCVYGFPYFSQTFVHTLIAETKARGHRVTIISCFDPNPGKVNSIVQKADLLKHVYRLTPEESKLYSLLRESTSFRAFAQTTLVEKQQQFSEMEVLKVLNDVDIIHGCFGNDSSTLAMLLSHLTGIPFSFDLHAYDLFVQFPFAQEKIDAASFVVTVSDYNKRFLLETYSIPKNKVSVIGATCDNRALLKKNRSNWTENSIVSSCRLHPIKGITAAVDACRVLRDRAISFQYEVFGDGIEREMLEQQIQRLDLQESVFLRGERDIEEVFTKLEAAAVFLLPCQIAEDGDRDATPLAIMEAMSLGVPVVSTSISGIPELIEDGVHGLLVPRGDPVLLADALQRILTNPELATEMGKRGREKARTELALEPKMRKFISLWESSRVGS